MSNSEFGSLTLLLFLLMATAHVFGYIFACLRQPRVVGEIFAGVLLGPSLFGHFLPKLSSGMFHGGAHETVVGFVYNLGLLLLMFASGAETKGLFHREDRREVAWLASVGTLVPFMLAIILSRLVPVHALMGRAGQVLSLLLIVGIAVSVTSIPVISRILHDLGILHTRFARLILGVAVIEDIGLWAVLAVATALADSGSIPQQKIALHIAATLAYFAVAMTIAPALLKRITSARWNVLATTSPVGYVTAVLLGYSAVAALLDVSLVFAAFLAGYALASECGKFSEALESVKKFSFGVFIPIYFAIVGYKLDLSKTFSLSMLVAFLAVACAVKLVSAGAGARLAGFGWRDSVNLAVATNARGGPGIVLASVAFDAGIINAAFYTTLVLVAVLTSQAAGAWLEFVLRRGWPLLQPQPVAANGQASEEVAA